MPTLPNQLNTHIPQFNATSPTPAATCKQSKGNFPFLYKNLLTKRYYICSQSAFNNESSTDVNAETKSEPVVN